MGLSTKLISSPRFWREEIRRYSANMYDMAWPARRVITAVGMATLVLFSLTGWSGRAAAMQAESACLGEPLELSEPVELCGVTTLVADGPRAVDVWLPQDATLDIREAIDNRPHGMTFATSAPFAGVFLTDHAPSPNTRNLFAGRYDTNYSGGIYPYTLSHENFPIEAQTATIPAGPYSLYLITPAESSMTVTIELGGLIGSRRVEPQRPVELDYRLLQSRLPGGTSLQRNLYSAGTTVSFEGEDDQFVFFSFARTPAPPAQDWGLCFYDGAPQPEDTAYLPGCPARATSQTSAFELHGGPQILSTFPRVAGTFRGQDPGTYGIGTWWLVGDLSPSYWSLALVLDWTRDPGTP